CFIRQRKVYRNKGGFPCFYGKRNASGFQAVSFFFQSPSDIISMTIFEKLKTFDTDSICLRKKPIWLVQIADFLKLRRNGTISTEDAICTKIEIAWPIREIAPICQILFSIRSSFIQR